MRDHPYWRSIAIIVTLIICTWVVLHDVDQQVMGVISAIERGTLR